LHNRLYDLKGDHISFYDNFFIIRDNGGKQVFTETGASSIYDYKGNKLIDKSFQDLSYIGDNLLRYTINGKKTLIDISGKEIVPPICNNIVASDTCKVLECYIDE
jgi:hypothetical protein